MVGVVVLLEDTSGTVAMSATTNTIETDTVKTSFSPRRELELGAIRPEVSLGVTDSICPDPAAVGGNAGSQCSLSLVVIVDGQ